MSSPKEVPAVPLVVSVADHDNYCFTIALHDLLVHTISYYLLSRLIRNAIYPCSSRRRHTIHHRRKRHTLTELIPAKLSSLNFLGLLPVLRSKNFLTVAARTSGRGHMDRNCLSGRISSACAHSRLHESTIL